MNHSQHILTYIKSFLFIFSYLSLAVRSEDFSYSGDVDFISKDIDIGVRILSSKKYSSKKYSSHSHSSSSSSKGKSSSRHRHCLMQADFDTHGVYGYIKAQYVGEECVDFHVHLDLGDFQPDSGSITSGSQLNWHLHTDWKNYNMHSGVNSQCAASLTGNHYDPTVACSPASEWVNSNGICYGPDGQVVDSEQYMCTPTSNFPTMCERGDESGKLGPLIVEENSYGNKEINFRGRDDFFASETAACTSGAEDWSFVLNLGSERILCAKVRMYC